MRLPRPRPRAPRSLSGRLVATAVALVAVVSLVIATLATLAIRGQLMGRLDASVLSSVHRSGDGDRDREGRPNGQSSSPSGSGSTQGTPGQGSPGNGYGPPTPSNQGPGTLIASVGGDRSGGIVLTEQRGGQQLVTGAALARLTDVPTDGQVHTVDLPGFGHYRVAAVTTPDGDRLVSGLPTRDVDQTVAALIGTQALLILLGLALAAGFGTMIVRRQLRPLRAVAGTAHRVSAMPLSSGAIDLDERVPADLTDERTEVGQVGAALNTLLAHVETSLEARHRSEQHVRQFVADASHELRTPLSTIHGYAQLSRRTPDDPVALTNALNKVETEAHRMSALVEDLLLLARLDSGRPLASHEVDLTHLLLESAADARVVAPDHHWRLDLPDEPVTVTGDADRLHQVVTNLLNNARNHTPPGTKITLGAQARADDVVLTVHDDGPGLPPGLAGHAFERFTRGDSSRTRASGGAGLGLSLVAAITQAHGGSATVASRPGDTTFTLTLPRATAA